jgi:hypothetical protein
MHRHAPPADSARRNALLCALAVAVCILLTRPFLEMPVNDDFSYTRSAFDYAHTGHILYNGWATAMLGWQIVWGGLAARLFGDSFTAVRLSLLPFAMGSVYLMYMVLARFGANAWNASIGALTLGLSPMFIPLAASFMSDVPALFSILLCLYMCQLAVDASTDRAAILWLTFASAINVLDGTVRQIVWLGALVMVPSAAWLMRSRRRVAFAAVAMWPLSAVGVAAFLHWFQLQPYSVPLRIWEPPAHDLLAIPFYRRMLYLLLTVFLLCLPLLIAFLTATRSIERRYRLACYAGMACAALGLIAALQHRVVNLVLWPWMTNVLTIYGTNYFPDLTNPAVILPPWLRFAITLLLLVCLVSLGVLVVRCMQSASRTAGERIASHSWRAAFVLTIPFTASYTFLIVLRAMHHDLPDRYVLILFPTAIIVLLLYFQHSVGDRLPSAAIAVLAILAMYSTAVTHDYFSTQRARFEASQEVERSGVPRYFIHAFAEYDAWTQLLAAGHINDENIQIPPGAHRLVQNRHPPPLPCRFWYSDLVPAIHPHYVVVFQPSPCFTSTTFPAVKYRLWLPPFKGEVFVEAHLDSRDWAY